MEKEFLPYDLALELKDVGFNEECFAWYNMSQDNLCFFGNDCCADMYAGEKSRPEAPLYQQAFRFFREKYRLEGAIYRLNFKWASQVFNIETSTYCFKHQLFETYEEAEINSLQKIIEIVKNKSV